MRPRFWPQSAIANVARSKNRGNLIGRVPDSRASVVVRATTTTGSGGSSSGGSTVTGVTDFELLGDVTGQYSNGQVLTEIAADAVGSNEIAPNAVQTSELADTAVTTPKLADLAVTSAKLATDSVTAGKILTGSQPGSILTGGTVLPNNVTTNTQAPGTGNLTLATTEYVDDAVAAAGGSSESYVAGEALSANDAVEIYDDSGTDKMRKANASNGRDPDGFVTAAVALAATGAMIRTGIVAGFVGLTPGAFYVLSATVAGEITLTAPTLSGHRVWIMGQAISATELKIKIQFVGERQ
jgi:hypothetical protein